MKLINLIEDTCTGPAYHEERGLSFYVETDRHKIIVDTGATDAFLENAQRLGLDLSDVDTVVITHGHYDHCGGLKALLELAPNAVVYAQDDTFGAFYNGENVYDGAYRHDNARYVGADQDIANLPQVKLVSGDVVIDDELRLFANVEGRELWPVCNTKLSVVENDIPRQDDFGHEQFLAVTEGGKTVLFCGCCHSGVVNVMAECTERLGKAPDALVGGFHMMEQQYFGFSRDDLFLVDSIGTKLAEYPTRYFTCHCTGITPYNRLKAKLGSRVSFVHSGDTVALD